MKKLGFWALLMVLLLSSCASLHKQGSTSGGSSSTVTDGEGSSYKQAVVIKASSESDGIKQEYKWIDAHYPEYKIAGQSLAYDKGVPYDILHLEGSGGKKVDVYFNISSFFGKF